MEPLSRRRVIGAAAAAGALLPVTAAAPRGKGTAKPHPFLWGVATAAHQIEGNNVNSDYWLLENVAGTGFPEPSGDACNSWERWPEDVALVRGLGLNAYRFSVEWARIEPEPGVFSNAVLDHYRRMCAACREAGISPVVTYHHFTSPRWIAARGGWENPDTADRFARYCERVTHAIGDFVDWGCTINEPNAQVTSYVVANGKPFAREAQIRAEAARATGSDRFHAFFQGDSLKVRDVTLIAHRKGVEAIKGVAPHMKVGITLALQDLSAGPGGEALYRRIFDESRAPYYALADRDDFIGMQTYNRMAAGPSGYLPTSPTATNDAWGRDADAEAIAGVAHEITHHCRAPILITENGVTATDDRLRMAYLDRVFPVVRRLRQEGLPLLGYIHWSLLDNFEWGSGYKPRFGLYAVDRTNFRRTAKPSAALYRSLVAQAHTQHLLIERNTST